MISGDELNDTQALILGVLVKGRASGSGIYDYANSHFGSFFKVTRSQVFRELPYMAELKLVKASGLRLARGARPYWATPAGEEAFSDWLVQPGTAAPVRDPAVLRYVLSGTLTDADRAALAEDAQLAHLLAFHNLDADIEMARLVADSRLVNALHYASTVHWRSAEWWSVRKQEAQRSDQQATAKAG